MVAKVREVEGGVSVRGFELSPDSKITSVTSSETPSQKISSILKEVFLPQGYPGSVSGDYMEYQIWDTLQELCSALNGTLASHATFKGMGVGDASATALGATYTWILKDGSGMISNILFAWSRGTQLDIDAKRWRLFADVVNDLAMMIDLLSPLAPATLFTPVMCLTTVLRSLVGVAGGCTRATIKQHQAIANNTADVSAKDGSQERLSSLVGLFLSMCLMGVVTDSPLLTWPTFLVLTFLHLFFNYKACSCLVMCSLNPARYAILLKHWMESEEVLDPRKVNQMEPFITGRTLPVVLGASLLRVPGEFTISDLEKDYLLLRNKTGLYVCYRSGVTDEAVLESYYFAYQLIHSGKTEIHPSDGAKERYLEFKGRAEGAGWDTSFAPLGVTDLRYRVDH